MRGIHKISEALTSACVAIESGDLLRSSHDPTGSGDLFAALGWLLCHISSRLYISVPQGGLQMPQRGDLVSTARSGLRQVAGEGALGGQEDLHRRVAESVAPRDFVTVARGVVYCRA